MPAYIYADHGDLAPYLSVYPGLFGLYEASAFVSNKPPSKRSSRNRNDGFFWTNGQSHFSSPSASLSSTQTSSPYLYTFYDDSSSITSPQHASPPQRTPSSQQQQKGGYESSRSRRYSQQQREEVWYEPSQPLRRTKAVPLLPRMTTINVSPSTSSSHASPASHGSPAAYNTPPSYTTSPSYSPPRTIQRRNAVRRESKLRTPVLQTNPAIPLPSLMRLDALLDSLSSLIASTSTSCPPSNSSPKPLARGLQAKLIDLQPYLSLTERELLPDQESPSAASHLRHLPRLSSRDAPPLYERALGVAPATDAAGAARWRALTRIGRDPQTQPRRELVPSVVACLTVQTVVRHVLRLVDWRGRDFGNPRSDGSPAYSRLHSYRDAKPRKRAKTAPVGVRLLADEPRVIRSRWAPEEDPGVDLCMPTPFGLRVRRLERMDLRLQRVLVAYAEAIWGRRADTAAWLAWVKQVMVFEGFLVAV